MKVFQKSLSNVFQWKIVHTFYFLAHPIHVQSLLQIYVPRSISISAASSRKRIRYDIKNKRRREKNTKEEEREEINMAEQIPRETQARITMKRPGLIAINQTIG